MKKFLPIMLALAVSMGLSQSSFALEPCPLKDNPQYNHRGDGPHHRMTEQDRERKKQEFIQRLNLNEKQRKQIKELHEKGMKEAKPIHDKKRALKDEIRKMKKEGATKKELKPKFEELRKLRDQAKAHKDKFDKKVEAILDPEQQKEFRKMLEEHKEKRKEYRQKRKEERKTRRELNRSLQFKD